MSPYELGTGSNVLGGGGPRLPMGGNTDCGQRDSGYLAVTRRALLLDCAHDTSHRDFHVVIDSRSVSRKKRDRDTGLCRQNRVSRCWKSPRGAPGKGRRADVAWILRGASAQKPIRLFGETGNPPDFGSPAGYGLDGAAVFGSSPQPSGLRWTGRQVSLRRDPQRSRSYSGRRY